MNIFNFESHHEHTFQSLRENEWLCGNKRRTRLISIESQPKKVVVVVVTFFVGVSVVVVIVGHRNLTLKFV